MQFNFDQIVAHLHKVRAEHGAESFHHALTGLFRSLLEKPGGDEYIKRLLEEFGVPAETLEAVKAEVHSSARSTAEPSLDAVRRAIEVEMPHCKTQAQFDLVIQAWNALRLHLNAVYGFDRPTADQTLEGLNQLLELAPKIAHVSSRLEDNPEATTNRDYVDAPKEVGEHHVQQTLLAELADMKDMTQLQAWYGNVKPLLDSIVSQKLRDELFDAIRAKKQAVIN